MRISLGLLTCSVCFAALFATPAIAAVKPVAPAIRGVVTAEFYGSPVASTTVTPYKQNTKGAWIAQTAVKTDASGAYQITASSGTYRLQFTAANYVTEYHNNAATLASGTSIVVSSGTYTISAALRPVQTGSSALPYLVYDLPSLASVGTSPAAVYSVVADVDAAPTRDATGTWGNGGAGWTPLVPGGYFTGTLRGNGHTISNLYSNHPELAVDAVGLIGKLSNPATISDLKFVNCTMTGNADLNGARVAALAGWAEAGVQVRNVDVSGTFSGHVAGSVVGQMGGYGAYTEMTGCDSSATVNGYCAGGLLGNTNYGPRISKSSFRGVVTGSDSCGGLVGQMHGTTVTDCYVNASLSGVHVGGFVGQLYNGISWSSSFTNCYSASRLNGTGQVGGLLGYVRDTRTYFTSTYYDSDLGAVVDNGFGTPKTTSEMYGDTLYSGWDLANVWATHVDGYPTLR